MPRGISASNHPFLRYIFTEHLLSASSVYRGFQSEQDRPNKEPNGAYVVWVGGQLSGNKIKSLKNMVLSAKNKN